MNLFRLKTGERALWWTSIVNLDPTFLFLRARLALLQVVLLLSLFSPAAARELVLPPNGSPSALERAREDTSELMALAEEELAAIVPVTSAGIRFVRCANCDAGSSDLGRFRWTPLAPRQIECENCGERYPGNPRFPEEGVVAVAAPGGVHKFDYWVRPDGIRVFFAAHADYHARSYLERRCLDFAILYHATGEDRYARRAAVILQRFAEVYPRYPHIYDFPNRQIAFTPYDNPRMPGIADYRIARWEWWAFRDLSPFLLQAYELLLDWPGWGEATRRFDREMVENDLLGAMAEYVRGLEESWGNMSPRLWRDLIYAGRVLNRPEWVHDAIGRLEQMLEERFLYDGHWMETSPSYANQVMGTFASIREVADGYTDPPGYRHPETGRRFDRFDLDTVAPQYALARRSLLAPRLPDGRMIPLNDTWAGLHRPIPFPAREAMEPVLLPGLGVAVLGGGAGPSQFHAHLNFTAGRHHKQRDALSIGFFAHGEELYPDLGYSHTRFRPWVNSTMSHNTVVVDGRESEFDPDHTGNRLVEFVALDGFQLAAAESATAYPHLDRYRRTVFAVGLDGNDVYLVDLFQVQGGRQHDYLLHGSADVDSLAQLSGVSLSPFEGPLMNPGVEFRYPEHGRDHPGTEVAFGFIRELEHGSATGGQVVWQTRLESRPVVARSVIHTREGDSLFSGRSPSVRRAEEANARLADFIMPTLVWRRVGEEGLNSVFAATHEASSDGDARVKTLHVRETGGAILLTVALASGETDLFLVGAEDESVDIRFEHDEQTVEFSGRYGWIRRDTVGQVVRAALIGGTHLRVGDWRLEGGGVLTGEVSALERNGPGARFLLEEGRSAESSRTGVFMVEFPDGTRRAFSPRRVQITSRGLEVDAEEPPGFRVKTGSIQITSFPQREIAGDRLRYRLSTVAAAP